MTRETKIGLIVAGSFLCLVCIVVASKWNRGNDGSKEPEQQEIKVAAVKPTQNSAPDGKKKDAAPKSDGAPRVEFPVLPARPELKGTTPSNTNTAPPPAPDFPRPPTLTIPAPLPGAEAKPVDVPLPPMLPPAVAPGVTPPPAGGFEIPKPMVIPMPPLLPVGTDDKKNDVGPMIVAEPTNRGLRFPPLKPAPPLEEKRGGLPLPEPVKPGGIGALEIPPALVSPALAPPPKTDIAPAPLPFTDKNAPPSFPLVTVKDTVIPPLGTPTPLPKDGTPAPPSLANPLKPIDTTPPGPVPKIPGTGDLTNTPPIALPGATKPMPIVTTVNTDPYICQAGDTNFAIVSQRLYGTDKYADALLAYNREHYKFIKNGTALLSNPPALTPGQYVEHPPASVLERSYRAWIREGTANTIPTIPPTVPAVKISTPVPLNSGTTPGVATISVPPSAGKSYTVRTPGGESIFDVAERTLGNRSQWPEIWRINQGNPAVRPPAPIPAGTELRLP